MSPIHKEMFMSVAVQICLNVFCDVKMPNIHVIHEKRSAAQVSQFICFSRSLTHEECLGCKQRDGC